MTTHDKRDGRKGEPRVLQAPSASIAATPGSRVWAGSQATKPTDDSLRRYAADRLRHFAVR